MKLDPSSAALYALIAISLVLVGAILTPGSVSIDQRGAILGAIAALLLAIAWRSWRKRGEDDE